MTMVMWAYFVICSSNKHNLFSIRVRVNEYKQILLIDESQLSMSYFFTKAPAC